jgi:cyclic pyranopterin phosphate synthase
MELSHLDGEGRAQMVDVGAKADTERVAVAKGRILMQPRTLALIQSGTVKKGDVLTVAQVAGIQAAKRTHELIPMCHPLMLTHIAVDLVPGDSEPAGSMPPSYTPANAWIDVQATVRTRGKTGVEMEALTAASAALLTVYDMCKAADRAMRITDLHLVHKSGGKSGAWNLEDA